MRKLIFIYLILLPTLQGCQFNFYLQNQLDEDVIMGCTELDKNLIFRQEVLRNSYKKGVLTYNDGLRETSSVKYVMQQEDNNFYITFFGTDTAEDIYYDLSHNLEPFWSGIDSDIRVHAGFNRPILAIAPQLLADVNAFLDETPVNPHVFIIGHSAGGVHAVLSAFFLVQNIPAGRLDNFYCQTGGSPAPGNSTFAEYFEGEPRITCHRYINGSDMMPSLYTKEMGYFHVGQAYRIGAEPNPLKTVSALWLTDHFIGDYAESLRQ